MCIIKLGFCVTSWTQFFSHQLAFLVRSPGEAMGKAQHKLAELAAATGGTGQRS